MLSTNSNTLSHNDVLSVAKGFNVLKKKQLKTYTLRLGNIKKYFIQNERREDPL